MTLSEDSGSPNNAETMPESKREVEAARDTAEDLSDAPRESAETSTPIEPDEPPATEPDGPPPIETPEPVVPAEPTSPPLPDPDPIVPPDGPEPIVVPDNVYPTTKPNPQPSQTTG